MEIEFLAVVSLSQPTQLKIEKRDEEIIVSTEVNMFFLPALWTINWCHDLEVW